MEVQAYSSNPNGLTTSIDCLSEDNFQHILSYIPKLGSVALVCRKWNASAQVQHILQRKTFETIKEIAQRHYLMPAVQLAKVSELLYLFEIVDHHFSKNQCDEAFLLESEICRSLVKHITYRSVVFLNSLIKLDDRRFTLIIKLLLSANRHSEAKSLASHLENEAPKRHKKFILFIKEHKIYSYFKKNDWMLATKKINHLSRHFPRKAEKLSLKMIDLQQNKIDFIPIELFQYILSYVPGLFNASLVSKRWNRIVPAFLQFKFPEEKRNSLEYVNALAECRAFSAAEIFYSNYSDQTYAESISKLEIFTFVINENIINFLALFKSFEDLAMSSNFLEEEKKCAELMEKQIENLFNNFFKNLDNNLSCLSYYLRKFEGTIALKPFCTHLFWPLFRKACKEGKYLVANKIFQLIKKSEEKEIIWSCFSDCFQNSLKFFKTINSHSLINTLLYSMIYSLKINYSDIERHLDSFIFQFNMIAMLKSAAELTNFPLIIKILVDLKNKKKEIDDSLKNINYDLLYKRFIKNFDYNLKIIEFYFNKAQTDNYSLAFSKDLFWPLVRKACLEEDTEIFLKLIKLLVNTKNISYSFWDSIKNDFSFEEISMTLFQIPKTKLKVKALKSFFYSCYYSDLKTLFNLFLIIKHLKSINELKVADELTANLTQQISNKVKSDIKAKKLDKIIALKDKHFVKLYEVLINSNHYEEIEKITSLQLSLDSKYIHLIIDAFLNNNKWDQARVLVSIICSQRYSEHNQEELISKIDMAEAIYSSQKEAEVTAFQEGCAEFYEKEVLVKNGYQIPEDDDIAMAKAISLSQIEADSSAYQAEATDDYDEFLYDVEYDEDMYGSGSDLSDSED